MVEATKCCGGNCGCKGTQALQDLITWEPLPDLSNESMAALLGGAGGAPLQRSVQRLVKSLDDPNGVISAFSSFAET